MQPSSRSTTPSKRAGAKALRASLSPNSSTWPTTPSYSPPTRTWVPRNFCWSPSPQTRRSSSSSSTSGRRQTTGHRWRAIVSTWPTRRSANIMSTRTTTKTTGTWYSIRFTTMTWHFASRTRSSSKSSSWNKHPLKRSSRSSSRCGRSSKRCRTSLSYSPLRTHSYSNWRKNMHPSSRTTWSSFTTTFNSNSTASQ